MGKETPPTERVLTGRQHAWLGHLRAIERSGKRVKDYTSEQGIPVQSLYQGAKRLRKQGLLPASGCRSPKPKRFVKVAIAPASAGAGSAPGACDFPMDRSSSQRCRCRRRRWSS